MILKVICAGVGWVWLVRQANFMHTHNILPRPLHYLDVVFALNLLVGWFLPDAGQEFVDDGDCLCFICAAENWLLNRFKNHQGYLE